MFQTARHDKTRFGQTYLLCLSPRLLGQRQAISVVESPSMLPTRSLFQATPRLRSIATTSLVARSRPFFFLDVRTTNLTWPALRPQRSPLSSTATAMTSATTFYDFKPNDSSCAPSHNHLAIHCCASYALTVSAAPQR